MLKLQDAEAIARCAMAYASREAVDICVCVAGADARIIVFFKMDATKPMDGHEAMRRAVMSASTGRASEDSGDPPKGVSFAANEGIGRSSRPGGLPLIRRSGLVGGIGVYADDPAVAVACARAGVDALPG